MRLNHNYVKHNVLDTCLLVSSGNAPQNGVFTINETAEQIYDLVTEGKTREEIITKLMSEYDSTADEVAGYVDVFLDELRQHNVLLDD